MTLVSTPPPDERRTFSDMLERLGEGKSEKLSLREMVEGFGERGFGAVILMLALMALFPWPPGGKAVFSVPIILIAAELALQRDKVWLPRWLLNLSVNRASYCAAAAKILPRLRRVERLTRPRWHWCHEPTPSNCRPCRWGCKATPLPSCWTIRPTARRWTNCAS